MPSSPLVRYKKGKNLLQLIELIPFLCTGISIIGNEFYFVISNILNLPIALPVQTRLDYYKEYTTSVIAFSIVSIFRSIT